MFSSRYKKFILKYMSNHAPYKCIFPLSNNRQLVSSRIRTLDQRFEYERKQWKYSLLWSQSRSSRSSRNSLGSIFDHFLAPEGIEVAAKVLHHWHVGPSSSKGSASPRYLEEPKVSATPRGSIASLGTTSITSIMEDDAPVIYGLEFQVKWMNRRWFDLCGWVLYQSPI